MTAKQEILKLMDGLPDTPTFAEVFDRLRPIYNREVAPLIAQFNPPRVQDVWRSDITGWAEYEKQKTIPAHKAAIVKLMQQFLPDDATMSETVNVAAYELVILYGVELSRKQIAESKVTPHEEIKRRYEKWFAQLGRTEPEQTLAE